MVLVSLLSLLVDFPYNSNSKWVLEIALTLKTYIPPL